MAKLLLHLSSKINKETGKSEILLRFIDGKNMSLRVKSNIFIEPKHWNVQKKCIKINKSDPETIKVHTKLSTLCTLIIEEFGITPNEQVTKTWLYTVVDKFHYPDKYIEKEKQKEHTLFQWIEYFILIAPQRKDKDTGRQLAKTNLQQYKATYKHLKALARLQNREDYKFCDIDIGFYNAFIEYLQGLNFTANSVGKHIKIFKLMLNDAPRDLRRQADYSDFRVFTEDVDNIYLDKKELQQLKDLDLTETPYLDNVKDWFLLLAWTGSRFSDLAKIDKSNIRDGFITFRQQKTNAKVTIPLHPVVVDVLTKYNYNMPETISNQRFNTLIKVVAQKAGFIREESITRTIANKLTTTLQPKYKLISSHTGRRSFATNMYKDGLPPLMIMSITGHKTEKSFLKYIKVTQKEHAEMMAKAWESDYKKG